jgi:hypothetical protein
VLAALLPVGEPEAQGNEQAGKRCHAKYAGWREIGNAKDLLVAARDYSKAMLQPRSPDRGMV